MGTTINKILVANRGEIARRIIRTCRAMGIATVAVCSDADRHALFVAEADEAVPLGGLQAADSYLRSDAILDAAKKTGSDAIHPGYGFLSENAQFARACQAAGIAFIGPPADVVEAMGSKIEAKRQMHAAGVPLLPTIEVGDEPAEQIVRKIECWPVLIKASAGGGGRGMRVVRDPAEFAELLSVARAESRSAFGDATVFVEPCLEAARHVEVQIFGDAHGNIIHLFERECSIQRRHQKIIEESPSPAVDDALRRAMTDAAVRGAQAIGYVNAGTFEFLLTPDGKFYFLEVNTRLQVEHPVTECVTGLDLVRLQILVAAGEPLPVEAREAKLCGHAIEARLYAEDPRRDYLPSAGALDRFRLPEGADVRLDSAIDESGVVSPYYDPMVAKVIAQAPPAPKPRGSWPARWPAREFTACEPIASCWCGCSRIGSFLKAAPTPIFSSATTRPPCRRRWPTPMPSDCTRRPRPWRRRPSAAPRPRCWPARPPVGATIPRSFNSAAFAATSARLPSHIASSARAAAAR